MPFGDVRRRGEELGLATQLKDEDVMQLLGAKPSAHGSAYQPSDEERRLRAAQLIRQRQHPNEVEPAGFARMR